MKSIRIPGISGDESAERRYSGRMKRRLKPSGAAAPSLEPAADARAILQVKVWLAGISPMVWWRVLVPATFTLRELHGVIQAAMGWEGIHLYIFRSRAARYGTWELSASSPDVTLADLHFTKGAWLIYEYDQNIPWRHEGRIEDQLEREARKTYPVCARGDGACLPEDCGGPERCGSRSGPAMTRHSDRRHGPGARAQPWLAGRVCLLEWRGRSALGRDTGTHDQLYQRTTA